MKPNHSALALLIALALHGVLAALFWISVRDVSEKDLPYREKRFGVLLSEESTLSETVEPSLAAPKAPAGLPVPPSQPVRTVHPQTQQLPAPQKPSKSPLPQVTPAERDILPRSVLHHYGEAFFDLSAGEQHYIIDNLQRIRKINEVVGTRLLRDRHDDEIDPGDSNIVEFYLNPDGTISDLHLQKNRIGTLLDELTLQTIALAHPRYPRPEQTTLIRIRVYIVVK